MSVRPLVNVLRKCVEIVKPGCRAVVLFLLREVIHASTLRVLGLVLMFEGRGQCDRSKGKGNIVGSQQGVQY